MGEAQPPSFENQLVDQLGALYTTALRLTKNQQRAEDLVQETSLQAWRHRDQVNIPHAFKGWIFKILMNTFINRYRSANREPRIVDIELTDAVLEQVSHRGGPGTATPLDLLLEQCLDDEVQDALDQLHTDIRTVVWLFDVEGLSYRDIAEMLGCSPGTVASRLFRGRGMLREILYTYAKQRGKIRTRR